MQRSLISILYFLTSAAYIIFHGTYSQDLNLINKGLIIPFLIFLFVYSEYPFEGRNDFLILSGLIFSWAGDIFLELEDRTGNLFIAGLLCFLLTHLLYIAVFIKDADRSVQKKGLLLRAIPVAIYGVALVIWLYPGLGEMKIPVIIYSAVILTMLFFAEIRSSKIQIRYYLILAGALLFVSSDSMIAINKFRHPFQWSDTAIMTTYVIAQYLIIGGIIYKKTEKKV